MSRSRKRTPVVKTGCGKEGKRRASRQTRRCRQVPAGKSMFYKKLSEQWDIWDYRSFLSSSDAQKSGMSTRQWERFYQQK